MPYTLVHKTDHADQGVSRFLQKRKGLPKIEAWARSYLDRVQELEDLIQSVITSRMVASAVGVQLDYLGVIVGQPRISANDDVYRLAIKARIRINISQGWPEDLLELGRLLFPDTFKVRYSEEFPLQIRFEVLTDIGALHAPLIAALFFAARMGGVAFRFHFNSSGGYQECFSLGHISGDLENDAGKGLGHYGSTEYGGKFSTCFDPGADGFSSTFVGVGYSTGFSDGFGY